MKEKAGIVIGMIGLLLIAAAVDTYSKGGIETMQFLIQSIAGIEAMAVSYILSGRENQDEW